VNHQAGKRGGTLTRELDLFGAVVMGLGSILGTGVFVSLGVAAGIAGPAVIVAVVLAALIAICNGLSSAQLAATHPVSGGTYEYGYRYLSPQLGFTAGWLFLLAKSASAATAALGFAGYLLSSVGWTAQGWLVPVALATVLGLTLIAYGGVQKSRRANGVLVCVTLAALGFFVMAGVPLLIGQGMTNFRPMFPHGTDPAGLLQATALLFVAYGGYARITTMAEEVRSPAQTIPCAIILCLGLTMAVYLAIAIVAVGVVGAPALGDAALGGAPLVRVVQKFGVPGGAQILAVGAMTALLGVLLNLILGLSRVLLAMARRGDMPRSLAQLNAAQTTPGRAVLAMGGAIALLVLVGNVKTTWSFSAFSVLGYYALANLAALQLPRDNCRYPRWIAWVGLGSCGFLAFWVEPQIWLTGLGAIGMGLVWKAGMDRWHRRSPQ
jgi:basic amino acid/polyamine antiporter, APA family